MWVPIVPEHIWSQFKTYDQATKYLNSPPIVGSGPFQVVEWQKGKFVRAVANKDYWGGKPKVDEIVFEVYKNQDTLAHDLKLGTIDLAINIPPAQVKALQSDGAHRLRGLLAEGLRLPVVQLLQGTVARQPRAARRQVPPGAQLGGRQGQADRARLPELRRPGDVDLRGQLLRPQPRLALAAAGRRQVHVRPREGQAGSRRRRLQGHRRRRHPQRPQERRQEHQAAPLVAHASRPRARSWASSSPAGGRTSASTSSTRSRTTASSSTAATTTSATRTSPTTTSTSGRGSRAAPTPAAGSATSAPCRSRTRTTPAGRTSSTTRCGCSSPRSSTRRSARRSPTRCRRSCTRSLRTSSSTYPKLLEAWNTPKWEGWQRIPQPNGAVAYISDNVSNYYKVAPKAAETATSSGSSNTTLIVIVVAAVVVVVAIVLLLLRRKPKAEEG